MNEENLCKLENMYINEWQLHPNGSETIKMTNENFLDKCKEIIEKNEGGGKMFVVDSVPQPEVKHSNSISVKIFIAGDYDVARKLLNDYCFKHGCCVNLVKNTYIYSAGEEHGVAVELINYPRFPKTVTELENIAYEIALLLRENLNQDSFTIQCLKDDYSPSKFYSWRHMRGK